jgi:hypothetical protein
MDTRNRFTLDEKVMCLVSYLRYRLLKMRNLYSHLRHRHTLTPARRVSLFRSFVPPIHGLPQV